MRLSFTILVLVSGCHSAGSFAPLDDGRSLPLGNDHPRPRALADRPDGWRWTEPSAAPSRPPFPEGGWTILALEHGPRVMDDCIQGGLVNNIEAFWNPAPEKVAEVDVLLGELLAYQVDRDGHPVAPLSRGLRSHVRQYVGVRAGGRSLVYVAAYSAVEMAELAEMSKRVESGVSIDWHREPLGEACDGGTLFFRAAFDVAKSKFVMFSYGGPVGSCCEVRGAGAAPICGDEIACRPR